VPTEVVENIVAQMELIILIVAIMVEKENTVVLMELIIQTVRSPLEEPDQQPQELQKQLQDLLELVHQILDHLPQEQRPHQQGQQLANQNIFHLLHQHVLMGVFHQTVVLTEDEDLTVVPTELQIQIVVLTEEAENIVVQTELIILTAVLIMAKANTVVLMELITQAANCQQPQFEQPQGLRPDQPLALYLPPDQQLQDRLVRMEVSHQTVVLTEDVDLTVVPTELQIQTVSFS
jgi:hypothetical protein